MGKPHIRTLPLLVTLALSGIAGCSDASPEHSNRLTPSEPSFDVDNCDGTAVTITEEPLYGTSQGYETTAEATFSGTKYGQSCAPQGVWHWYSSNSNIVDVLSSNGDYSPYSTVFLRGGSVSGTAWIKAQAYDPDFGVNYPKADSFQVTNSNTVASIEFSLSSVTLIGDDTSRVVATPVNASGLPVPGTVSFSMVPTGIASITPSGTNAVTLEAITPGDATLVASASGEYANLDVNVYPEYDVEISGPVNHCMSYGAPVYTASAQGGTGAPYAYQWWVDGLSQYESSSTFEWTGATAGAHTIVVEVYNVGADTLTSHIYDYC